MQGGITMKLGIVSAIYDGFTFEEMIADYNLTDDDKIILSRKNLV